MSAASGADARLGARLSVIGGPAIAAGLVALGPPAGLSPSAWIVVAILALMVIWWISEAIPPAATALLPLVLLPSLGIVSPRDAAMPYADPIIFLFIGGFMLAAAVEKWNLHARLALSIAGAVGSRPIALMGVFMLASGLLSMWISNTATALILTPIAIGVASALGRDQRTFGAALVLAVAYAASIGGIGTPVGSPTNLVAMGYLERSGLSLSFTQWMALGVPLMIVMLMVAFVVLGGYLALTRVRPVEGGRAAIREAYSALGPLSQPELRVALVFAAVALLWVSREALNTVPGLGGINDTGIAMAGVLAMFLIPSGDASRSALLDWPTAERIPWGIALLFGAGLTMAEAMDATGVTAWLGANLAWLNAYAPLAIVAGVVVLTVFASELASNVATLTAFLPIVGGIAVATGIDPLLLVFPASMGASLAFMLPIGTPPNAIAYASGYPSMRLMLGVGLVLNVAAVFAITLISAWLSPVVLN